MVQVAGRRDAVECQTVRRAAVLTAASEDSSHCFLGLSRPFSLSGFFRHPVEGIYKHIFRTTTGKTRAPRQCAPGNLTPYRTTTVQKHNKRAKRTKGTHCPAPEPALIPVGSGTYNFKPTPHATTIDVTASSNTGAVRVTFPDGWLYVWTAATPQQLELLFAGPVGRYTTGQIAQNVVLTDQTSLRNCLFRFTSHRLFQILGSPAMSSKGAAPAGIYIFWGDILDWTKSVITLIAESAGAWTFTTSPADGSMSDTCVIAGTKTSASPPGYFFRKGNLSWNGTAQPSTCTITMASTVALGFYIQWGAEVYQNGVRILQADNPGPPIGVNPIPFTVADTGGASQPLQWDTVFYDNAAPIGASFTLTVKMSTP